MSNPEYANTPKTIKVKSVEHDGDEVTINEEDFDPDIHEKVKSNRVQLKHDNKKKDKEVKKEAKREKKLKHAQAPASDSLDKSKEKAEEEKE